MSHSLSVLLFYYLQNRDLTISQGDCVIREEDVRKWIFNAKILLFSSVIHIYAGQSGILLLKILGKY